MILQTQNKYIELEFDDFETESLIRQQGLFYDEMLMNSLEKTRRSCLKSRVKNARFGVNISPGERLKKVLDVNTLEHALRIRETGFDFVSLNLAQYLAINSFGGKKGKNNLGKDYQSILPQSHYDLYFELINRLKGKLEFIFHLPTDDFIYHDETEKLFISCVHLAHQLSHSLPQLTVPLTFHAYRAKKTANLENDLQESKSKTASLIVRAARFLEKLEKKSKLKISLALEITNQELPTSHYVRYCTSPYQVLETFNLATKKDSAGLVSHYLESGSFSTTCDIGSFVLDQKFNQLSTNKEKLQTNNSSLYYGFDEYSRKISVYHITNVHRQESFVNYLDNRRRNEFSDKFGQLSAHHTPVLANDVEKVGEVLKQVELFQNMPQ